jgi:predicted ATPase/DNA-binding NarL/FixJ family response regulator
MTTDIAPSAGNLPAEPNSFIGRERDLTELAGLLGQVRALTLCGPGGIGKTRLALRVAAGLAPEYPDGAWIVDLADAGDPALLVPLVAAMLGIRAERDLPLADTLTAALRPRAMLLILDTCERLVDVCAELAQQLLADCPGLRIIATSREPLRIRGEVAWRVPPLGLPPGPPLTSGSGYGPGLAIDGLAGSEAVQLFCDRAAAAWPGFTLGPGTIEAVAQVCRTLDGVPLAIELAAARVRTLSADQIAARLADRFALLASGDRTAPRRQQTLRAAVDWSYELLTGHEQMLLRRLSVFAGWNLEMVELICVGSQFAPADVLDLLTALIDKSLVIVDREPDGDARYRLLDLVREYAVEQEAKHGDVPALRLAHRDCMLALVERGFDHAYARADTSWSRRVALIYRSVAEQANFRLALACSLDRGDAEEGLRLCVAQRFTWMTGGDATAGLDWLDRMLALDRTVCPGLRAQALLSRAEIAFERQDYPAAGEFARECMAVGETSSSSHQAGGLRVLAFVALMDGRFGEGLDCAEAAIVAAQAAANEWEIGGSLLARAAAIAMAGRFDEAQRAFEAVLDFIGESRGWGRAQALYGLGRLANARGDKNSALRYLGAALSVYREVDAKSDISRCLAAIGWVALSQQELALARSSLTESLQLSLAAGQRLAVARGVEAQAALAVAAGNLASALQLVGASLVLHEAISETPSAAATRRLSELLIAAQAEFGPAQSSVLLAEGRAMSLDAVAALAAMAPEQLPAASAPESGADRSELVASAQSPAEIDRGGLTPREYQVAALVTRGLSNRAIARELVIAPSTAARHVANIFTKLGFSSRAQLAAWLTGYEPRVGS